VIIDHFPNQVLSPRRALRELHRIRAAKLTADDGAACTVVTKPSTYQQTILKAFGVDTAGWTSRISGLEPNVARCRCKTASAFLRDQDLHDRAADVGTAATLPLTGHPPVGVRGSPTCRCWQATDELEEAPAPMMTQEEYMSVKALSGV
jgi:hypothetical protein